MTDQIEYATLPTEVFNKILNVLSQLPFGQVAPLITEIQKTVQVNPVAGKAAKSTDESDDTVVDGPKSE